MVQRSARNKQSSNRLPACYVSLQLQGQPAGATTSPTELSRARVCNRLYLSLITMAVLVRGFEDAKIVGLKCLTGDTVQRGRGVWGETDGSAMSPTKPRHRQTTNDKRCGLRRRKTDQLEVYPLLEGRRD